MPRNTLPLTRPPAVPEQPRDEVPAGPALEPLLLGAGQAGLLCGRSEASWWRDHAAGRVPRPVKLGGRTLWRRAELEAWVAAGCPPRKEWEAREAARNGRR